MNLETAGLLTVCCRDENILLKPPGGRLSPCQAFFSRLA
jgi:hypothetical protein